MSLKETIMANPEKNVAFVLLACGLLFANKQQVLCQATITLLRKGSVSATIGRDSWRLVGLELSALKVEIGIIVTEEQILNQLLFKVCGVRNVCKQRQHWIRLIIHTCKFKFGEAGRKCYINMRSAWEGPVWHSDIAKGKEKHESLQQTILKDKSKMYRPIHWACHTLYSGGEGNFTC